MKHLLTVLSLAALVTGCASHRESATGRPDSGTAAVAGGSSSVSSADSSFAAQACQAGSTEMEIGKLAASNTRNASVRRLAKVLAEDHGQAEKELARLFVQKGIPQEKYLAPQFQSSLDRLAQLRDQEFDRAFKQQVIQDHEKAIELFEQQSRDGADPQLKAFAERHLPQLREHLAAARQLEIGVASATEPLPGSANPLLVNPASRVGNTPK